MPPEDPDEWTDDQWIEWLKATDEGVQSEVATDGATTMGKITKSTTGQMIGQAMLGLAQAMYGKPDDEVTIVVDGSSGPADDEPFAVRLDHDNPERSAIIFRPAGAGEQKDE